MTLTEFSKTSFGAGDRAIYDNKIYPIASVDFQEQLIGLVGVISNNEEEISWVRCENIEFIPLKR